MLTYSVKWAEKLESFGFNKNHLKIISMFEICNDMQIEELEILLDCDSRVIYQYICELQANDLLIKNSIGYSPNVGILEKNEGRKLQA